ncbi:MAG: hypothetical protein ACODAA_00070 [Gemmatimonadota bacterium]
MDPDATPEPTGEAAEPTAKREMPTGLKVAIGCIVVFFGFAAISAVLLGAGGWWIKGQADDLVEGVQNRTEAQQEASGILERLGREHPFTAPADGRIDPASAERFFGATELAWTQIEPTVRRLDEVADRNREGRARLGDALEGFRGTGVLIDSRLHIARALDEAGMSLEEYVWTGGALRNAHRDANAPEAYRGSREAGDPVMLANIALAEEYAERLESMDPTADEPNAWTVYNLATVWSRGLPDGSFPSP